MGNMPDESTLEPTRESCIEQVSHPGPFECCAPYVPFYWEIYLGGMADRDDGTVLGFDVSPSDRKKFPELKGRHTVKLIQDDDGFIYEA